MKKNILISAALSVCSLIAFSQTKLQYSVHAIHAGIDNPMMYCKHSDPGSAGASQKWDFSKLVFVTQFTGYVSKSDFTTYQAAFPKANTVLSEFNSQFFLNTNEHQVEQYGYVSANGKTRISYSVPFIKMKFPFSYGDNYSGTFIGTYSIEQGHESDISGNYTVEADAYGTLVLPGNSVFNDVIRVKTTKEYTTKYPGSDQLVEIITYRWYNAVHRYPLLVLTEFTTTSGGYKSTDYQAAYNSEALKVSDPSSISISENDISLYPNPAASVLHLTFNAPYTGTACFGFYDTNGRNVFSLQKEIYYAGVQEFDLSEYVSELQAGQYIMKINIGSASFSKEFVKSDN